MADNGKGLTNLTPEEVDIYIAYVKRAVQEQDDRKAREAQESAQRAAQPVPAPQDSQAAPGKPQPKDEPAAEPLAPLLAKINAEADAACAKYAVAYEKLFEADGTPRYSEAVHAKKSSEIIAELNRVFDAEDERLVAFIADRNKKIEDLNGRDSLFELTDKELAAANLRAQFVREDVMRLSPDELVKKIEAAIKQGDRVTLWLMQRYVDERQREFKRARDELYRRNGGRVSSDEIDQLPLFMTGDANDAAKELIKATNTFTAKIEALQKDVIDAGIARNTVRKRKDAVDGSKAEWDRQYGEWLRGSGGHPNLNAIRESKRGDEHDPDLFRVAF